MTAAWAVRNRMLWTMPQGFGRRRREVEMGVAA